MKKVQMICFANSYKCSGRCVAGKTVGNKKWVRPVSSRSTQEISLQEMTYKDGALPQLLDCIEISFQNHVPNQFQTENFLIDPQTRWLKKGVFSGNLQDYLDRPTDLWGVGDSSYQGENDRIACSFAPSLQTSLYLIQPSDFEIIVREEGREFNDPKRKIRGKFTYNNVSYLLPITDPVIRDRYLALQNGSHNLNPENIYLCVSLGLPHTDNNCYKFLSSIIETE